jgi:hypothetical protein
MTSRLTEEQRTNLLDQILDEELPRYADALQRLAQ